MNLPEFLYKRVCEEFSYKVEQVYQDMLDVMTGNKTGNEFEREFTRRVYERYLKETQNNGR